METPHDTFSDYSITENTKFDIAFVDINSVEKKLLTKQEMQLYLDLQSIPVKKNKNIFLVATANAEPSNIQQIKKYWGDNCQIAVITRKNLLNILVDIFSETYKDEISDELYNLDPDLSSKHVLNFTQKILFSFLFVAIIAAFLYKPLLSFIIVNIILTLGTLIFWGFKFILSLINLYKPFRIPKNNPDLISEFPMYTILVPLLRENENIVNQLITALLNIDYPLDKLDIKLLLEQHDKQTLDVLQKIKLPDNFQLLIIPQGKPLSKPRACNYGLKFALGEYVTIYDAEDIPDPKQLKKVLQCFNSGDEKLLCLQAALNFYNSKQNLLTRFFTIEYTVWFEQFLNSLSRMKVLLPLGGTSNHFKTRIIKKIGAWDPYAVTEDTDMGIRMSRFGYYVSSVNSTTYEEANSKLLNWLRQRVRWNKGYLQSYLVHMRHPFQFLKQVGFKNFCSFQLFVGGNVFAQLVNLPIWIIFMVTTFVLDEYNVKGLFPGHIWMIGYINFFVGTLLLTLAHFIGVIRTRLYHLLPFVPFMFLYWLLMSVAGLYSLFEIIIKPSYWYKTKHMNVCEQKRVKDLKFTQD